MVDEQNSGTDRQIFVINGFVLPWLPLSIIFSFCRTLTPTAGDQTPTPQGRSTKPKIELPKQNNGKQPLLLYHMEGPLKNDQIGTLLQIALQSDKTARLEALFK